MPGGPLCGAAHSTTRWKKRCRRTQEWARCTFSNRVDGNITPADGPTPPNQPRATIMRTAGGGCRRPSATGVRKRGRGLAIVGPTVRVWDRRSKQPADKRREKRADPQVTPDYVQRTIARGALCPANTVGRRIGWPYGNPDGGHGEHRRHFPRRAGPNATAGHARGTEASCSRSLRSLGAHKQLPLGVRLHPEKRGGPPPYAAGRVVGVHWFVERNPLAPPEGRLLFLGHAGSLPAKQADSRQAASGPKTARGRGPHGRRGPGHDVAVYINSEPTRTPSTGLEPPGPP